MMTYNVAHASAMVGALVLGVLLPAMAEDMGLSPLQQGWLGSSAIVGSLFLSIPFGLWFSRFKPMLLTAITLILGAGFVFMQAAAPNFTVLLLGRLLFGLTPVAREASRVLLVRQWLPKKEIQLSSGILNAVFGVSLTVSFVVAPMLLEAFDNDWRQTLYAWGYFSVGMAVAWLLFGRENRTAEFQQEERSQEGSPMKSLFKYKEPWLLGIAIFGYAIAQMSQFTFWPTYMQEKYDMSLVQAGFIVGVVGVVVAAGGVRDAAGDKEDGGIPNTAYRDRAGGHGNVRSGAVHGVAAYPDSDVHHKRAGPWRILDPVHIAAVRAAGDIASGGSSCAGDDVFDAMGRELCRAAAGGRNSNGHRKPATGDDHLGAVPDRDIGSRVDDLPAVGRGHLGAQAGEGASVADAGRGNVQVHHGRKSGLPQHLRYGA